MSANGGQAILVNSSGEQEGRFSECFRAIPMTLRLLLGVNIGKFIFDSLIETNLNNYAICWAGEPSIPTSELWWRIFSSAYTHAGFLHILFNMMALFQTGAFIEQIMGTSTLLCVVVLFTVVNGALYYAAQWIIVDLFRWTDFPQKCAVGFSGVLFSLFRLEASVATACRIGDGTRSVCGMCKVPNWLYPWVMLILMSIVLWSSVSFVGHLVGILGGVLYCRGFFLIFSFKRDWMISIESIIPSTLTDNAAFFPYPREDPIWTEYLECIRNGNLSCPNPPFATLSCPQVMSFCANIRNSLFGRSSNNNSNNNNERQRNPPGGARLGGERNIPGSNSNNRNGQANGGSLASSSSSSGVLAMPPPRSDSYSNNSSEMSSLQSSDANSDTPAASAPPPSNSAFASFADRFRSGGRGQQGGSYGYARLNNEELDGEDVRIDVSGIQNKQEKPSTSGSGSGSPSSNHSHNISTSSSSLSPSESFTQPLLSDSDPQPANNNNANGNGNGNGNRAVSAAGAAALARMQRLQKK